MMPGLCSTDTIEFFRIVRVVYVKPTLSPVSDAGVEIPSLVYPISYETFVPDVIQTPEISSSRDALRVDPMKDTFAKAVAFLQCSGSCFASIGALLNKRKLLELHNLLPFRFCQKFPCFFTKIHSFGHALHTNYCSAYGDPAFHPPRDG